MSKFEIEGVHSERVVSIVRSCCRAFSPESVYRMGRKKERAVIHLFGTREQKTEDLEYFRLFADENGIAFSYKKDKVFLGQIED